MSGDVLLSATRSVCPECLRVVDAFRVQRGEDVVLRKGCPEHGWFEATLWRGEPPHGSWKNVKTPSYPRVPFTAVRDGCPWDCGLCPEHRQHTCTALIEVTERCDLRCAFCFADGGKKSAADDLPVRAIRGSFEKLLVAGGPYNIQLSGGEPTLRDDLPEIVELGRSLGFDFIQVNTNGLRLARESGYARVLKEAGVASVFLQFDGMKDAVYEKLRGRPLLKEKMTAVERCAECDLAVVLVPTVVPGVNADCMGEVLRYGLRWAPTVRGVHFQPVSYFGRHPGVPGDAERITIPEILRAIETQTDGAIQASHFKPPGCENAWCSFHGNFVLMEGGELHALTRHDAMGAGAAPCRCKPEPAEAGAAASRRFVSRSWASPAKLSAAWKKEDLEGVRVASAGPSLGGWDALLDRARTHSFCVSGMAFQDAWSLDLERLKDCCIHVVHPDGRIIPFCAYNLTDARGRSVYRPGKR